MPILYLTQVINVSTWILASASSENKMGSVCSGWLWKMWHEETGAKFEWLYVQAWRSRTRVVNLLFQVKVDSFYLFWQTEKKCDESTLGEGWLFSKWKTGSEVAKKKEEKLKTGECSDQVQPEESHRTVVLILPHGCGQFYGGTHLTFFFSFSSVKK